jgi:hypothetical protein
VSRKLYHTNGESSGFRGWLQPHKPGGDRLHDLVRPGKDPDDQDIPPSPGDRIFFAVTVTAEKLHAAVGHAGGLNGLASALTGNSYCDNSHPIMADKAGGKKKEREKRIREERTQRLRRAEAENHHFSASMHYRSRNFAEARRCLQKAIMVQPNHLAAHQLLAQIALDEKNLTEAVRVLRVIVKNWPEETFACYFLGVVLMDLRKYDEARDAFQAFLAAAGDPRLPSRPIVKPRNPRFGKRTGSASSSPPCPLPLLSRQTRPPIFLSISRHRSGQGRPGSARPET